MCGLVALISEDNVDLESLALKMTKKLRHRGPDSLSIKKLDGCSLGHTRLSILDLTGGVQPMGDEEGRYWIVFNGELYNFQELRKILENFGHRFATNSDTEVVLHGVGREMLRIF